MEFNFDKQQTSLTFGVPYDGLSIMHYKSFYFSSGGGKSTIESLIPGVSTNQLGSSKWMTKYDKQKLRKMYKCSDTGGGTGGGTGQVKTTPKPPPTGNSCKVKEENSKRTKECKFPFKF